MEPGRAEIVGAGLVGLTLACALARRNWIVRVHERAPELREIGAGIYLWENALRALEDIDAFAEATARAEHMDYWELRDDRMRLLQREWMLPGTNRIYTVLRTDLLRGLANAAKRAGVEIATDSKAEAATADGELTFADGTPVKADLIVGADGINSRIRESLGLLAEIKDLRDGASRHLIERTETDPKRAMLEHWRGGRRVGVVPCSPDQVYIYLACAADDNVARAQTPGFRDVWTESFPHFQHVIERIPDGGWWAGFNDVICRSWSRGRVALIGDAAHAMSPTLAQAACVAMMSAYALSRALESADDVPSGLAIWERTERPLIDFTQRWSRYYSHVNVRWPERLVDLRSAFVWLIASSTRLQAKINQAALHMPTFEPVAGRVAQEGMGAP